MVEWTRADVVRYAPELAAVDDPTFDEFIADASLLINRRRFGRLVKMAGALMTAHLITLSPPASLVASGAALATAPVASESVGSVSVSYAGTDKTNARGDLALTRYGVRFASLAKQAALGGVVL